jgi:predicted  nucleic acid-binding Zn-ribbon protein
MAIDAEIGATSGFYFGSPPEAPGAEAGASLESSRTRGEVATVSLLIDGGAGVERGERILSGSLSCVACGYSVAISAIDELPRCPACGGSRFRRHRLFEERRQETTATVPIEAADEAPSWLEEVRGSLPGPGHYLAYEEDGKPVVARLEQGWTRIGRSGAADVRLDDPTVSRRHALVVRTPGGELRAMDDRSLNGLHLNGERTEWAPLKDGDELEIGRFRLYVLQA